MSEVMRSLSELTTLQVVPRLPRSVETTAKNIETHFGATAEALIETARQLESRAADLREKADVLLRQVILADDLRKMVNYEQEAFREVQSLALVNVSARPLPE